MSAQAVLQLAIYTGAVLLLAVPLGALAYRAVGSADAPADGAPDTFDQRWLRRIGIDARREMTWLEYASALLIFHAAGFAFLYSLLRLQAFLPLNPAGQASVAPDLAFNTAVSFITNTNWQSYGGETTMSHLSQMLGLTVQNFTSAASGIAVMLVLARGLMRRKCATVGNFWSDLFRVTVYLLLPLCVLLALALASQGVVNTLAGSVALPLLDPVPGGASEQTVALGPAAAQIAIKQLGTNGGGFFNVNSAHPLENSSVASNFLQAVAILALPAALCATYGRLVKDRRQGAALLASMLMIFVAGLALTQWAEQRPSPWTAELGVRADGSFGAPAGNLEGKELRFGVAGSAFWSAATTAASNGSVNSMLDSYSPAGSLGPMALIQLGEVVFGGVGSGIYGIVCFVLIAAFTAGLLVGRTPEYLGKKLEPFEMKMAILAVCFPSFAVLAGTAAGVATEAGRAGILEHGAHGFSEVLYALSSASNNNGSAFAGLSANTPFYNLLLGAAMFFGRFGVMVPVLAMAGSLARKGSTPPSAGTLPTHSPLFIALLTATILIVGALTFFPALALGPLAEELSAVR